MKTIAAFTLFSALLPRFLRLRIGSRHRYPGPLKELEPDKMKKEGPWAG